jgi:hypothetical protein
MKKIILFVIILTYVACSVYAATNETNLVALTNDVVTEVCFKGVTKFDGHPVMFKLNFDKRSERTDFVKPGETVKGFKVTNYEQTATTNSLGFVDFKEKLTIQRGQDIFVIEKGVWFRVTKTPNDANAQPTNALYSQPTVQVEKR